MNTLKPLSFLFAALILMAPLTSVAADKNYVGSLSGVECSACKKKIATSLAKLKGVKTIRIVKQDDDNHRLEVLTDGSKEITQADAEKALKKAKHYKILSWAKS
ncbi:MAG: heavy metal-associated domain-containing protein [Verrucomicrobiota bacterium]